MSVATELLAAARPAKRVLADKAHDADHLRHWLKQHNIEPVIPSTVSRRRPYTIDRIAYRLRNVIKRTFCILKNWRPSQRTTDPFQHSPGTEPVPEMGSRLR